MTELEDFINTMRATSSSTEKVEIIKNSSKYIHDILEATYNPYKQYYVTSKTCIKNSDKITNHNYPIFEMLDKLTNREVTGHEAIALVNGFNRNTDDEVIYKIIDKDLGIRAGAKVINKAINARNPKTRYAAGAYSKLGKFLRRIMTDKMFDRFILFIN